MSSLKDGPRYQASPFTEHGCCWGACVLDTTEAPRWPNDTEAGMMLECADIETAIWIAHALNAKEMQL